MPAVIVTLGSSVLLESARDELIRGFRGMTGRTLRIAPDLPQESAIVLAATSTTLASIVPQWRLDPHLKPGGYYLKTVQYGSNRFMLVSGADDRGVLYGTFALLRKIASGEPLSSLDQHESPYAPVRWVNQWDNLDGSIERGYGGRSIFFANGAVREDLSRAAGYARLLASIGINGCAINNVNANPRILETAFLPQIARIAAAFRPWGVSVVLAIDFGSPKSMGGLDTFDFLDPRIARWWTQKIGEVYRAIPDLAAVVMKADSEGRAGPSAYRRTHADAAQCCCTRAPPIRRSSLLSRFRLRPPHGLAQSQK